MKILNNTIWTAVGLFGLAALVAMPAAADQVILDDLIVDGSACIGQDCVNGESFGFDTIRIKENNLRIKAQDTSSTASFPSNDWQITFNESTNGGRNKFSIDDIDGGRTPFTIEASAPSHSLYVDDGGRLGFGTSTPVADLHVKSGNTPTLRLEQDGSSGFTAQTWDLAGNEANLFFRDATNGSTLPFRLFPGAPSNALTIEGSTGDIGLGTTSPDGAIHALRSTGALADMLILENNNNIEVELINTGTNGGTWRLTNTVQGTNSEMRISQAGSGEVEITINEHSDGSGAATLEVVGSVSATNVTFPSSRALKTDFQALDVEDVLAKVANLEMTSWKFKQGPDVRHIGPIAEDFHTAFPLAPNDKQVSAIDVSGVALAAIQGLHQKLAQVEAEKAALQSDLEELRTLVQKLIQQP